MKLFRLALALCALFPLSTFVSVQPAMAQANCRWDLDGEWVGQRTGNRVMQEMRPGGFMVWVVGTPKPGQAEGDHMFRDAGPKTWTWTFPDGSKTHARLEANGLLRVTNPDGWAETFKRVRPAGPPRCVGGNSNAVAAAPVQPAGTARPMAGPAGNRVITGITHADMKEMIESEGHTASNFMTYEGDGGARNLQATGTAPDGTRYVIFGKDCDHTGVSRCKVVKFMTVQSDSRLRSDPILQANSQHDAVTTAWFTMDGNNYVSFSWEMPVQDGVPMRVLRSGLRAFLVNQANAWNFVKGKLN